MSQEVFFAPDKFIVSKTDRTGVIQYVNQSFIDVSGFEISELIGRPHSIIRHHMMPRSIFKFFWDEIKQGKEFFAYVVNRCKNNDYYWVLAYVTPDIDGSTNEIIGYHSARRVPSKSAIRFIEKLYADLREEEAKHSSKVKAVEAGEKLFHSVLQQTGMEYHELIYALEEGKEF